MRYTCNINAWGKNESNALLPVTINTIKRPQVFRQKQWKLSLHKMILISSQNTCKLGREWEREWESRIDRMRWSKYGDHKCKSQLITLCHYKQTELHYGRFYSSWSTSANRTHAHKRTMINWTWNGWQKRENHHSNDRINTRQLKCFNYERKHYVEFTKKEFIKHEQKKWNKANEREKKNGLTKIISIFESGLVM